MKRVYYNKLIRDGIEEKIKNNGESCEVRVIEDDAEFQQELLKKVTEEASALSRTRTREEFLDEYADLTVALEALRNLMKLNESDIKLALTKNLERKGAFAKRHFLHWSDDTDYKSNETPQGIKK